MLVSNIPSLFQNFLIRSDMIAKIQEVKTAAQTPGVSRNGRYGTNHSRNNNSHDPTASPQKFKRTCARLYEVPKSVSSLVGRPNYMASERTDYQLLIRTHSSSSAAIFHHARPRPPRAQEGQVAQSMPNNMILGAREEMSN